MEIEILNEAGFEQAMLGLSLSYNQTKNMVPVAMSLCDKDGGHNKFLESMCVWLDITAPRYWWQEMATYRVGTTTNSESTMHTILRRELNNDDFAQPLPEAFLNQLNDLIRGKKFEDIKNALPEGFLQRRIVCTNYKALRHIISQRKNHRLQEWKQFCEYINTNAQYKELLRQV